MIDNNNNMEKKYLNKDRNLAYDPDDTPLLQHKMNFEVYLRIFMRIFRKLLV